MNDVTRTHEWTTGTGLKVTAKAELTLSEHIDADGWDCGSRDICKYHMEISVEGHGVIGWSITRQARTVNGIDYAASCGKLVISAANLESIDAMVAEVKSHPAYLAKIERERKADQTNREYDASTRKMHNAMGE